MICQKYVGNCTVTKEFCAKRHALSLQKKPHYVSACATCEVGIEAFNEVGAEIKIKTRKTKGKTKSCKRYESPYTFHYRA